MSKMIFRIRSQSVKKYCKYMITDELFIVEKF